MSRIGAVDDDRERVRSGTTGWQVQGQWSERGQLALEGRRCVKSVE